MLSALRKASMLGKQQCIKHCLLRHLPLLKLLWLAERRDRGVVQPCTDNPGQRSSFIFTSRSISLLTWGLAHPLLSQQALLSSLLLWALSLGANAAGTCPFRAFCLSGPSA